MSRAARQRLPRLLLALVVLVGTLGLLLGSAVASPASEEGQVLMGGENGASFASQPPWQGHAYDAYAPADPRIQAEPAADNSQSQSEQPSQTPGRSYELQLEALDFSEFLGDLRQPQTRTSGGEGGQNASEDNRKHAVIVSVPLIGHLRPMLVQGEELLRRGWSVEVISTHSLAGFMASQPGFLYRDVGDCGSLEGAAKREVFARACNSTEPIAAALDVVGWCIQLYPCLWKGILDSVRERRPDLVISDMFTNVPREDFRRAMIQLDRLGLLPYPVPAQAPPHAVNVPFPLYTLGPHLLPPADYLPPAFNVRQLAEMGLSLWERAVMPPVRFALRYGLADVLDRPLNRIRAALGLAELSSFRKLDDCLVLVNTAFPFEYPRPIPPQVVMTGALVPPEEQDPEQLLQLLTPEERRLLEVEAAGRPVIYANMGTLAAMNPWQEAALLEACDRLRDDVFCLWRRSDRPGAAKFDDALLPPNVRRLQWLSSQPAILAHPAVAGFVSHCGFNSVHESLYYGTPLLCVPMFTEQTDSAVRLVDQGAGLHLPKTQVTAENLLPMLRRLSLGAQSSLARGARRVQRHLQLAGGVRLAADRLEEIAELGGVDHLVTPEARLPEWAFWGWDVMAVYLGLLVALRVIGSSIGRCCYRRCRRSAVSKAAAANASSKLQPRRPSKFSAPS